MISKDEQLKRLMELMGEDADREKTEEIIEAYKEWGGLGYKPLAKIDSDKAIGFAKWYADQEKSKLADVWKEEEQMWQDIHKELRQENENAIGLLQRIFDSYTSYGFNDDNKEHSFQLLADKISDILSEKQALTKK